MNLRVVLLITALVVLVAAAAVPALAETLSPAQPSPGSGPCIGADGSATGPCATGGQAPCAPGGAATGVVSPGTGAQGCQGPGGGAGGCGGHGAGGCGGAGAAQSSNIL